jgi:hypothetical protein
LKTLLTFIKNKTITPPQKNKERKKNSLGGQSRNGWTPLKREDDISMKERSLIFCIVLE